MIFWELGTLYHYHHRATPRTREEINAIETGYYSADLGTGCTISLWAIPSFDDDAPRIEAILA